RYKELDTTTPANIQLSSNTTLNYPNGANVARTLTGNLTVDAGSALYMDYGGTGMTNPLTVGGNVTLNGNVSLGDGIGGDLNVAGNWSKGPSCTFAPNLRAVKFNHASASQTITGGGTFDYFIVDKAAGTLSLVDSAVVVNKTLFMTNGKLVLGANNLTIGSTGSISGTSESNYIVTDGAGKLKQTVGAATATLFPIGISTSSYDPATVTPTTGTTFTIGVSSTLSHTLDEDATQAYINPREWSITPASASSTLVTIKPSAFNALYSGGLYNLMANVYDVASSNYSYASGVTNNSDAMSATFTDFSGPFVTGRSSVAVAMKPITHKSGIYASNGSIVVENASGKYINIYSLVGSKVRCIKNSAEKAIIPMEKGIYMVSMDDLKSKVLVK
ncbi:MAG: DUF6383 domain-containing protein, partial [Bacteroidales bacterium]